MNAVNFAKQTQQWMHLIEGFSGALKVSNSVEWLPTYVQVNLSFGRKSEI